METRPHANNAATVGAAGKSHDLLGRVVDFGLAGVVLASPLFMGGRHPLGRLVLVCLASLAAVAWCLQRALARDKSAWTWSHAELLWGAAICLVVLQLLPFSPAWLQRVSPRTAELLPLWTTTGGANAVSDWPAWSYVSLSPHATRGGLAMLLAYVMLFTVVSQRVRWKSEIERCLRVVALAGIGMACLGLLQYLLGNGKFLWFYEHPSRDTWTVVKGTFANENHFAHFLALTLGPVLWWLLQSHRNVDKQDRVVFTLARRPTSVPKTQVLLAFGLGAILLAGLLTFSRGGIAMMVLSATVALTLFAWQGLVGRRALVALGSVALVAAIAVWIHGQDVLLRELETLRTADLESLDQGHSRRRIWAAVTAAVPDFAFLGSGVGTHREVYPTYFNEPSQVEYSHAESGYLQVLLETGGPGFALLLCGIVLSGHWLARSVLAVPDTGVNALAAPLAAAWCVSVVHALADFNWFIPANMSLTMILMALGMRLSRLAEPAGLVDAPQPRVDQRAALTAPAQTSPHGGWALAASVVLVVSLLSVRQWVGPARAAGYWDEYLAWSLASNRAEAKSTGPGRQRRLGVVNGNSPDAVAWMIRQLEGVLKYDPLNPRANVRMAAMCLRQFELLQSASENAMSLPQIRDAALASTFSSRPEMSAWVTRAVGSNRALLDLAGSYAKRGLLMCPLQGRGYVYLSEVAFLDMQLADQETPLLRQAYTVRPFDPSVQFVFGRQQLLDGDVEPAMALWKEAFRRSPSIRKRIIASVGVQADPLELIAVFQPDLGGLKDMFDFYRTRNDPDRLAQIGQAYVFQLENQARLLSGETGSLLWFDAQFAHSVLGDTEAAADAALECVRWQPSVYRYHYACALRLREAGRLAEAIEELRWCRLRDPDNANLQRALAAWQQENLARQASRPRASETPPRR